MTGRSASGASFVERALKDRMSGFTLVEMLLAVGLMGVVGISLLATLNNGTFLWEKITHELAAENVDMFFDKISSDLRNSFLLEQVPFEGKADEVGCPVVFSPAETSQGIGRAVYSFDRYQKTLSREQFDFSGIRQGRPVSQRILVRNVKNALFSYYYYDPESEDYGWVSSWPDEGVSYDEDKKAVLPVAVRIEIGVEEHGVLRNFTRTVSIPAGCCRTKVEP